MIIAHHIILTGYGHWLPNDPRGSLSTEFWNPRLRQLGEIHFGRREEQPTPEEIRAFYAQAKELLTHPVVWFDGAAMKIAGEAFGELIRGEGLTCYACAVLRNHAHLLVRRHRMKATEMIEALKTASREALATQGRVSRKHPVWSQDPYVAYKDTTAAVRAAVQYIGGNFAKHRLDPQAWDFVVPYNNWPFHNRR